ncbi:protein LSM14 homolog B isoform X2 [Nasonia vitripennis]|uniref:Uncharacterized protein n=1 Tax=Nasonia vitripennis TaxID=7425 RepID=A0A7M7IUP1_NASVI|nr:protein LSM14 homolog B isoform X2 [Nasonia vitripennis]
MSAGMPELGSKISLISKADIRYEGRLFTVDPQECTIALANVKSFGTEDRETQFPVAPQNQVYEYILFRGSDIKDIRVVNSVSSLPNDPAIVQMTVQPSMGQQSYQPQPGYGHPMMGQMGPMGNQYGPPYGMSMGAMGPMMGMAPTQNRQPMAKQPSELGLGPTDPNIITIPNSQSTANVDPLPKDQSLEDGVLDIISGGSRSTTPTSLLARKSPTMDQGVQTGQQQNQANNIGKIGDKQNMRNVQAPHRDRDGHGSGRTSGMSQYSEGKQQQHRGDMGKDHHGSGPGGHHGHAQGAHGQNMRNRGTQGQGQGWGMNQRGGQMRGGRPSGQGGQGQGGRGRGGNFRNQQPGGAGVKPKNTLKFDNDYDFEQANTEFEELRSQLAKAKIDPGTENEKKDDSGNETGAGDNEPEEETEVVHYDKTKSFFDNISCEAVERSKGSQRTDWRTERKLNSETFGVASMRRGGFRGRGYYNRGNMGGGMYRNNQGGGHQNYRGGYRGQRGGGQRKPNPNQQLANNAQPSLGSTGAASNQNNRNATSSSGAQDNSNTASASVSANQPQQNSRLVTGTA